MKRLPCLSSDHKMAAIKLAERATEPGMQHALTLQAFLHCRADVITASDDGNKTAIKRHRAMERTVSLIDSTGQQRCAVDNAVIQRKER